MKKLIKIIVLALLIQGCTDLKTEDSCECKKVTYSVLNSGGKDAATLISVDDIECSDTVLKEFVRNDGVRSYFYNIECGGKFY